MSSYARANTTDQWYADDYPGARLKPNVVVLHTTEGTSWPSYSGGATAPNSTAHPDCGRQRLDWRAHFPDEMSSRALRNLAGGVETNTLNAHQVELVGTCAPATRVAWQRKGLRQDRDFIYWPEAPEWALRELGAYLADLRDRHGLRLEAPQLWLAYGPDPRRPGISPASYGASPARMTGAQWRGFYGVCGHQHVPENVHGDPGALPIEKILGYARGEEDDMSLSDADLAKLRAMFVEELEKRVGDVVPAVNPRTGKPVKVTVRTALGRLLDRTQPPGK